MSHPRTHSTHPQNGNRNLQPHSCSPLETQRRDSMLTAALVKIPEAFSAVPEPKSSWYETRQGDFHPLKHLTRMVRGAILAANASGDKQLLATTIENARAFCRELEADFVSLVPSEGEESLLALAIQETELEGAANPVQMALAANPNCQTSAERAIGPLSKHYLRLGALLEKCRSHARRPRTSQMVGLVP